MRDKYLIIFLGQGDYRLTNEGYSELLIHRKNINKIGGLSPEELTTLRELARKIGDRIRQEHNRVRSGNTHPGLPGKEAALLDIREEETLRIARKANKLVIGAMILSVITAIGVVVFQWLFAPRP